MRRITPLRILAPSVAVLSLLAFLIASATVFNPDASTPSSVALAQKATTQDRQSQKVTLTRLEGKVRVEIDGELFTEYLYKGHNKPILYPVVGPQGIQMTRNFPMKGGVPGEAPDHPHHRSLWYTHGSVNGIDFWGEKSESGKTIHDTFLELREGDQGIIEAFNKWVSADGQVQCTDTRRLTFHVIDGAKAIDYDVTLRASEGRVTLGDTKEGTMGIRTHPNLRLKNDPEDGVTTANGHALNSAGDRDFDLWGKKAKWVDYWGKIEGKTVGVAIFDHPDNPRHPTWWHARAYGLIAANAFGKHNFEKTPRGEGDFVIEAGRTARFRFRFVFHEGDAEAGKVAWHYHQFAEHASSPQDQGGN